MKVKLCVRLCLFVFVLWIFDSFPIGQSQNHASNKNPNRNPVESSECSVNCGDFKALEERVAQLEKFIEDYKLKEDVKEMKRGTFQPESHAWILEPLRGPPGEKGQAGAKGEIGQKGDEGWPGPKGQPGERGAKGDRGLIGQPGERGLPGAKGDRGLTGQEGKSGAPGRNGEAGIKGAKGDRGAIGPKGQPGRQGEKGAVGPTGPVGPKGNSGPIDPQSIKSCGDAMKMLPFASPRLSIYPYRNSTRFEVLCDFETDGGGWTIIQKRSSGPKEQFKQNWNEYEKGFGSRDGNFWLGLDNIHALTQNGDQELRIQLEDFEGNKKYAKFSRFSVSDASDFYGLTISGFSGDSTLNDSMAYHNGSKFSTIDKDNDNHPHTNCAAKYGGGGGWWFKSCGLSNLNGLYFEKGETVPAQQGIYWYSWKGYRYSHAKTEMKIRKRNP